MTPEQLRELLQSVQDLKVSPDEAVSKLQHIPFADLGFAHVDHHRALRQGVPEVIFGQCKTPEQISGVARELIDKHQNVLVTRLDSSTAAEVIKTVPEMTYHPGARAGTAVVNDIPKRDASVAVMTAGTGDIPVAEEAAETLRMIGVQATRLYDVGVAGIHRILSKHEQISRADALIVVAGMEGALPSVVGGLAACPVIAVPTSVGYGTHLGGLTPLFSMLSSCAAGVTVVNIDNGFGAAMAVHRILWRSERREKSGH